MITFTTDDHEPSANFAFANLLEDVIGSMIENSFISSVNFESVLVHTFDLVANELEMG